MKINQELSELLSKIDLVINDFRHDTGYEPANLIITRQAYEEMEPRKREILRLHLERTTNLPVEFLEDREDNPQDFPASQVKSLRENHHSMILAYSTFIRGRVVCSSWYNLNASEADLLQSRI